MFYVDKFIQCVQQHPSIWNKTAKEYSDRNVRDNSWLEIGSVMYASWRELTDAEKQDHIRELKNKWRHVRDSFIRNIQQRKRGNPGKNVKTYVYADALSFLLQQRPRKKSTSGNIKPEENEEDSSQSQHEDDVVESAKTSTPMTMRSNRQKDAASKSAAGVPLKRPRICEEVTCFQNTQSQHVVQHPHRPSNCEDVTCFHAKVLEKFGGTQEEDPDKSFLFSILPDYKKLNEDDKLDFRLHILTFFRDLRRKSANKHINHNTAQSSNESTGDPLRSTPDPLSTSEIQYYDDDSDD